MTPEEISDFEARRWEAEGWERGRKAYIGNVRGQLTGLVARRERMWKSATEIVGLVEAAHREAMDQGEREIGEALSAAKIKAFIKRKKGQDLSRTGLHRLMYHDQHAHIDLIVLECRTLMSARALSADFEGETLGELEARYLELIVSVIALWRRLLNRPTICPSKLRSRAAALAASTASQQRRGKPITMASRERFWRDRPAPVRKIFELNTPDGLPAVSAWDASDQ